MIKILLIVLCWFAWVLTFSKINYQSKRHSSSLTSKITYTVTFTFHFHVQYLLFSLFFLHLCHAATTPTPTTETVATTNSSGTLSSKLLLPRKAVGLGASQTIIRLPLPSPDRHNKSVYTQCAPVGTRFGTPPGELSIIESLLRSRLKELSSGAFVCRRRPAGLHCD